MGEIARSVKLMPESTFAANLYQELTDICSLFFLNYLPINIKP